ncbi:MAG: multiheme c-type cytochrome [Myxococcota bacterium]|nr:multiheme c-type cytochrome [Myxococcota bacterium]
MRRRLESGLATFALMLIPLIGVARILAWDQGPYADERSRLVAAAVAPNQREDPAFATSRDCQACHPDAYRAWHDSYHRKMTQAASPESVLGDFDDVELTRMVPARRTGDRPRRERYLLSRRGDEFWVTLRGARPGVPDRESRVVMTTGSHNQQVVWVWGGQGREIFHLPFTYLIEEGRWVERNQAFLSPPSDHFGEVLWNDVCIECHATAGQPQFKDGAPSEPDVVEFGISCESCHGPSREHVEANRSPLRRYLQRGEEDPTVTNPERLDARRASQVCGHCHSISSYPKKDTRLGHWNEYLPGDEFEADGRVLIRPNSDDPLQKKIVAEMARAENGRFPRDRFWADGSVRVAGREMNDVANTPCFDGGEYSCLSCHSLHQYESTDDQLAEGMRGDAACTQCHSRFDADITAHTKHAADSEGSRCMNCHNPYTTYGLLKAIRSHRVTNPSVATELETGRPNACNACHLDRSLAWTQKHLERDYGTEPLPSLGPYGEVPSGPRMVATGDAGVRALTAWYLGWEPALQASGREWAAPYLAELLTDHYAAVRILAVRSLRAQPGANEFSADLVEAGGKLGSQARQRIQARWAASTHGSVLPGPLLLPSGRFDRQAWIQLAKGRDTRPLALIE